MYTKLTTSDSEYLRKVELISRNPKYADLMQEALDKAASKIKNIAALEWRLTAKMSYLLSSGNYSYAHVKRCLFRHLEAEVSRESRSMAKHNVATFTTLERNSNEGESITFDAVSPVNIEDELLRNETINLVFNFASNDIERAMVYGMMDGLTDAEIGRRISEMDDNKYTLQAYRKAVRKFRIRCADALSTEV